MAQEETLTVTRESALGLQGLAESFVVRDDAGATRYEVKYKMHMDWQEWHVLDATGGQLATMQRHMHLHPTFTLDLPGHGQVTVSKSDFMPVNQTWQVTGLDGGDVTVSGSVTDHEFVMSDSSGQTVAEASRRWLTLHEGYAIRLQGLDPVIAVCAAVAMDVIENEHER